ncbi:hypothetical protein [Actinokineospora sp. NBRC 105648]|uniref:hypothetical protein n=1 Tax=Actinokineospora sp. NBRC 105648 TaxID=3032206 RepID=UPI0025535858|nr:hypothetical protein [Actinokineospora sp. NBRC 105648]
MATAVWIVTAALVAVFVVWRLRRANTTLATILQEEHARTDAEPVPADYYEDDEPHRVDSQHGGRHRKPH